MLAATARSKALTQHISWPHCDINGDHLAPLGNYVDNTLAPLGTWDNLVTTLHHLETEWEHLATTWTAPEHQLEQHGILCTVPCTMHYAPLGDFLRSVPLP